MKRILAFLLFASPFTAFTQQFIGKSHAQVKKELNKKLAKEDGLAVVMNDNDSTIVYSYKDDKAQPVDFIYGFDKHASCWWEKVSASCDSCFRKYLADVLAQKKYEWKKINENQYISRYADHLLIELPGLSNDYSYTILHTEWTREVYDMLKGN